MLLIVLLEVSHLYKFWIIPPGFLGQISSLLQLMKILMIIPSVISCHDLPELRKSSYTLTSSSHEPYLFRVMCKFSSYTRLQRTIAYWLRFINKLRNRINQLPNVSGPLSSSELTKSENVLIRSVQHYYYNTELQRLAKGLDSLRLRTLMPMLDSVELLRVGGRLQHASLAYDACHPYILPKEAWLASLLCDHALTNYCCIQDHNSFIPYSNANIGSWTADLL